MNEQETKPPVLETIITKGKPTDSEGEEAESELPDYGKFDFVL